MKGPPADDGAAPKLNVPPPCPKVGIALDVDDNPVPKEKGADADVDEGAVPNEDGADPNAKGAADGVEAPKPDPVVDIAAAVDDGAAPKEKGAAADDGVAPNNSACDVPNEVGAAPKAKPPLAGTALAPPVDKGAAPKAKPPLAGTALAPPVDKGAAPKAKPPLAGTALAPPVDDDTAASEKGAEASGVDEMAEKGPLLGVRVDIGPADDNDAVVKAIVPLSVPTVGSEPVVAGSILLTESPILPVTALL